MIAKIGQRWRRRELIVEVIRYESGADYVVVKAVQLCNGYAAGEELRFDGYKFGGIMNNDMCFEYLDGQDKPQGS